MTTAPYTPALMDPLSAASLETTMRPSRHLPARALMLGFASLLLAVSPVGAAEPLPPATTGTAKAVLDMEALAAKDDPTALVALAAAYYKGQGVAKDAARAAALYQRAAELGVAEAQYNLGNLYLLGEGVARDDDWAFTWFRAAARQGHALARRNVDEFYRVAGLSPPSDLEEGSPTPALGAGQAAPDSEQAQEHSAARHPQPVPEEPTLDELGALDALRSKGIPISMSGGDVTNAPAAGGPVPGAPPADLPAVRELLAAGKPLAALPGLETHAKAGNPEAQWMLSGVLAALKRSDYDLTRSLQWLRKSAEGGWRDAQFALGGRYERGEGLEADEVEAVSWYRAAARQGHPEALERLRAIYRASGVEMPPLESQSNPAAPRPPGGAAPARPNAGMDAPDATHLAKPAVDART